MAKRKATSDAVLLPTIRRPAPDFGPRATRMMERILEAARTVFLARGYAGTTVDEIARTAEISRASFYTYFPTKRDVLLALGANAAGRTEAATAAFAKSHPRRRLADFVALVENYFEILEQDGAFATAWTQAAQEDDEILAGGMRGHLRLCAQLSDLIGGGEAGVDSALRGLAAYSLVERAWSFAHLYEGAIDLDAFKVEVARLLYLSMVAASKT